MTAAPRPGRQSGDAEVRRWQRWSARALVKLLALADEERLPPLRWVVKQGLDVVGHVPQGDGDPAWIRAAFDRWVTAVGVDVYREETAEGVPGSRLVGQTLFRVDARHPQVRVTILAELLPEVTE